MELVPWNLQLVCLSSSFVCILSECQGSPHVLSLSLPYWPWLIQVIYSSPFLFFRALQDVQIRFQPQLNPDVVAPLPTHPAHEDFSELGNRRDAGYTDMVLRSDSSSFPNSVWRVPT